MHMKKKFKLLLALSMSGIIFSCNNSADTAKDKQGDTTKSADTAIATAAPVKPAPNSSPRRKDFLLNANDVVDFQSVIPALLPTRQGL